MEPVPTPVVAATAVVALLAAAMVASGIGRHAAARRPGWWALSAALCCFGMARSVETLIRIGVAPPSLRLPAWVAMLVATVVGTLGLARVAVRRLSAAERAATVDALLVTLAASLALWTSSLEIRDIPASQLWLSAATVLVQAAIATFFLRLLYSAYHLVAARWLGAAGLLAAAGTVLGPSGLPPVAAEAMWGASLLSVGLAALHPSMRRLADPDTGDEAAVTSERLRVRLLAIVLVAGPGAALVVAQDDPRVGLLLGFAMAALSGGFLWRVERLIDDRRAAEVRLQYRATHDTLTGLANRGRLLEVLSIELAGAGRAGTAVVLIDIDDFKLVNDGMGHAVGDRLLEAFATRLAGVVRHGDVVARLGGDEFAVVCPGADSATVARQLAERMAERLNGEYVIGAVRMHARASIGVAWDDGAAVDAQDLLSRADAAMYAAKRTGRGGTALYEPGMSAHSAQRLEIATRLWTAPASRELRLVYQPQVDIFSGTQMCAEALVRWEHPVLGTVSPGAFLDVAEQTGSIVAIGEWVLFEACRQAAEWHRRHPVAAPKTVSVNVSPRQLADASFVDTVRQALQATDLAPHALWLEVTETSVMNDADSVAELLQDLKNLGVGISIDDFGTGYSSMAYLRRFPIDALKIDRSFVMNLEHDERDFSIVEGVIGLARGLQLTTVAEGVETEQQLAVLGSLGCDMAQGYLLARPLPPDAFVQWMLQRHDTGRLPSAV